MPRHSTHRPAAAGPLRAFRPAFGPLFLPLLLALVVLPAAAVLVAPRNAFAQTKSFHMDQYNADITINPDGSFDVFETLVYVYESGSYHRGTRLIPLGRVESISNIRVAEVQNGQLLNYQQTTYDPDDSTSGVPGTFGTLNSGAQLHIRWVYDYVSNTTKTFRLGYHVAGGMRVYADHDVFDWYAVPQNWGSAINQSRVVVNLPPGFNADRVLAVESKPQAETSKLSNNTNSSITWTAAGNLDSGLEVGLQLPKGVVQVTKPAWQNRFDSQGLIDLSLLLVGVVLMVLGVLWRVMAWYRHGRDKPVKLLSDYITAPPSNLPPGLVGTLVDESADVRDVIATVVDQGRKGNLTIQETSRGGLLAGKDFEYRQTGDKVEYKFEEMVLHAVFKHGNPVQLSDLKNTFYSDLPPIYAEMYRSLVALKYFPEDPSGVRTRNVIGGVLFLVLGAIGLVTSLIFIDIISPFLFVVPLAAVVTGIAWMVTAGAMARKTDFGAEEAEKWRAFSRYLEQMQKYTDVRAAADKFQQYLPYAVALGIERQLISQFNSVPTAMPPWYAPYGYQPYVYYPYPVGSAASQNASGQGAGGAVPQFDPAGAMQGMSDSLASAMQGMSDSFTSMVNSATSTLTSQPQSSGGSGGWGGGGGGFGGGGGGGGGGGAD